IYSDMLQIMMFTLVPAGVITYLPVELIRAFSYEKLIYLILISALFVLLAFVFFGLGLRRYESGNQFSIKT
ncbi:MAG: hypothetical protein FJZ56_04490, partial [Chlamydiae bacterium]|nr:hypothetical protein [Chlamydiota bacterium]